MPAGRRPPHPWQRAGQFNMAKQRIVNTRFWDDAYIARLSPNEKLLFLYLLTSSLTNISGVYELSLKRVAFDVGLSVEDVGSTITKLQGDGKLIYEDGWIAIVRFAKYQTVNPKVRTGMLLELMRAPDPLVEKLRERLRTIGFYSLSDPNAYPKTNSNGDLDLTAIPKVHPAFQVSRYQKPKDSAEAGQSEQPENIKGIKQSISRIFGKA